MEEWRDIKDYEGYYQVSNLGRVRSLPRIITKNNSCEVELKGKILKNSLSNIGYYVVNIDGRPRLVHRLVAECFVENTFNEKIINHKDLNKLNNHYLNLEWCNYEHNNNHALKLGCNPQSYIVEVTNKKNGRN